MWGTKVYSSVKNIRPCNVLFPNSAIFCLCFERKEVYYKGHLFFKRGLRKLTSHPRSRTENIKEVIDDLRSSSNIKPSRIPAQLVSEEPESIAASFSVENVNTKEDVTSTEQKPTKAIDFALKIRKQKGEKRSPFESKMDEELDPVKRSLKALSMPDLTKMNNENLARLIRRNVIYADKRLVIFNKPYGLPIHDGDNISQNVKNVLPMVSKMVFGVNTDIPLCICNRLDKYTTGVCVTATNEDTSRYIQKMFREHKALKKYWAVTLGIPDPAAGVLDIPLDRSIIERENFPSYARMTVKPEFRYDELTNEKVAIRSRGHMAITYYKILDCSSLSLLELQPQTTVKHQLRIHLADGLACPILGDHKYSHFGKLAPQNLPLKIAKRFGIPSTKSRHTPLHLHLHSVFIPGLFPDQSKANLIVGAKTPFHMSRTMNMFGLKPGPPTEWRGAALLTPRHTAVPRNEKSSLYRDPTVPLSAEEEKEFDFDNSSVKVFRSNIINVKYKHR